MSQYTCRLYRNSGFNAVNIPDSPALLDTIGNYVDCYAIELNQERFLPSVRIRGDWLSCRDADYCKVGDFFYFVDNINMTSGDVAELSLTPDFITSAGGPAALTFLDGVTSRVHVSDDSFGLYGESDPYMEPAYDMDIESYTYDLSELPQYTFIDTTLDLAIMGTNRRLNVNPPALTATDPSDPTTYYVTYPVANYAAGRCNYSIQDGHGGSKALASPDGLIVYCIGSNSASGTILDGIVQARSLGIDDAITGTYVIPSEYISGSFTAGQQVSGIVGKSGGVAISAIPYKYRNNINTNNRRVWYGSQTPYILATCAGNSLQANAEETYDGSSAHPNVRYFVDPRRTGKPYFRFGTLNGQSSIGNDFFRNCVAGSQWRSLETVYATKKGDLLDQIQFNASQQKEQLTYDQAFINKTVQDKLGILAFGLGSTGGASNIDGLMSSAVSSGMSEGMRNLNFNNYKQQYALQKASETQQFLIGQNVSVPDIRFSPNPELFAEMTGNGFSVYRIVYKNADISRIDKILTAYGYKHTKQLTNTDFANRQYFNYVEAFASVGNLPVWWADGIAAQIGNGVRVWHVQPSPTYYTSGNPIVTPTV